MRRSLIVALVAAAGSVAAWFLLRGSLDPAQADPVTIDRPLQAASPADPPTPATGLVGDADREALVVASDPPLADEPPAQEQPTAFLLRGRVVDADGTGIPGAIVRVRLGDQAPSRPPLGETASDAAGAFEIDLSAATLELPWYLRRVPLEVLAEKEGFDGGRALAGNVAHPRSLASQVTVHLQRPRPRLYVRVLTGSVPPPLEARLGFAAVDSNRLSLGFARAEGDGRFSIELPREAGSYRVIVAVADRGSASIGPLDLRPDRDLVAPDIVVVGGGELAGTVVNPQGRPEAGVWVTAYRAGPPHSWPEVIPMPDDNGLQTGTARTGADGRFRIAGLVEGTYPLAVWPGTLVSDPKERFALGKDDVRLVIERYRILLRVRDEHGRPPEHVLVNWSSDSSSGQMVIEGDGNAEFEVEAGDTCSMQGVAPGRATARAQVYVEPGSYDTEVNLVLPPHAAMPGSLRLLTGEDGDPILLTATLQPVDADEDLFLGGIHLAAHSGETIDLLAPGDYRLEVRAAEGFLEIAPQAVHIEAGRVTDVRLRVTHKARVELRVQADGMEPGQPLEHLDAEWHPIAGDAIPLRSFRFNTGEKQYSYSGMAHCGETALATVLLDPGPGRVRVAMKGYRPAEAALVLEPDRIALADLRLERK